MTLPPQPKSSDYDSWPTLNEAMRQWNDVCSKMITADRLHEAERARLTARVEALETALASIDPLVLIEGLEDGYHSYRCIACHRSSRPDHAEARHFDTCIFYAAALAAQKGSTA